MKTTILVATVLATLSLGTIAQAQDLDAIFGTGPTRAEINTVKADWASRSQAVRGWRVEDRAGEPGDDFTLNIVSHLVDGNRHYAAVRSPYDYDPNRSYPVLVLGHGGWEGTDADMATGFDMGCLADAWVVLPSYRGEPLYHDGRDYQSDGEKSLLDRDVDDTMALISGLAKNYSGVQADNIAAWGFSRGSGTSMMLGVRDPRVDIVVGVYGPADVLTHPGMQQGVEATLRGADVGPFAGFPAQRVADAGGTRQARLALLRSSPLHFMTANAPKAIQLHHGRRDTVVPFESSERLSQRLDAIGHPNHQFHEYFWGGHDELSGSERRAVEFICSNW